MKFIDKLLNRHIDEEDNEEKTLIIKMSNIDPYIHSFTSEYSRGILMNTLIPLINFSLFKLKCTIVFDLDNGFGYDYNFLCQLFGPLGQYYDPETTGSFRFISTQKPELINLISTWINHYRYNVMEDVDSEKLN